MRDDSTLRVRLLSYLFIVAILGLIARLFFWQVVEGEELAAIGRAQQQSAKRILAQRGDILATDLTWLAAATEAWKLVATRPEFEADPFEVAGKLAEIFVGEMEFESEEGGKTADELREEYIENEKERIKALLLREELAWVPLKSRLSRKVKEKIEALNIPGLSFEPEEDRSYPEASSAAHLLGFVGKDEDGGDKGYFGLEGYYDLSLSGKPGYKSGEANALGIPIIFGASREASAISGVDLITHINKPIQLLIERYLEQGLEKYGAISGAVIVSRPRDGAILAMASLPSYYPDRYPEYSDELFRNPVISDGFEPGSILKPIVMAAGLDAGVIEPETVCDICGGPYKVDKYFIRTWNNQYNPGSNMRDVIIHSDNVGMAFVGNKLGADRLYDYLSAFGFGKLTGIDLQGEVTPRIREKGSWNMVDLATTSFGQGVAVTPIQMVKALNTIANGGVETTPQVVDKIRLSGETEDLEPVVGKRVISEEAANEIKEMMVAAVKDGEAKWAVPDGFRVAGKTGTAQIPVSGHYDNEKTIASFVGFAPPEDPEFLMLVTLREPTSSPWASETAAPLWFDIARELFVYFGIQPEG